MCKCIEHVNKKLAEMGTNTQLDTPISINFEKPALDVKVQLKVKKIGTAKKGPIPVEGVYCPFCGERYDQDPQKTIVIEQIPGGIDVLRIKASSGFAKQLVEEYEANEFGGLIEFLCESIREALEDKGGEDGTGSASGDPGTARIDGGHSEND
jgi:hypothetical protein